MQAIPQAPKLKPTRLSTAYQPYRQLMQKGRESMLCHRWSTRLRMLHPLLLLDCAGKMRRPHLRAWNPSKKNWISVCSIILLVGVALGENHRPQKVNFNRDILPILSDTCFVCHGPDAGQRQAGLRLDTRDGLFADRGGYALVVPGESSRSRLTQRISSKEKGTRMPPPWSNKNLTEKQIDLVRRWIQQGANWQSHWAFTAPRDPVLPRTENTVWRRNAIDSFVLAELERRGLVPSPEADRPTLIRRVTLDLTGVPPSTAEVDVFLDDPSPNAYEQVVDQLLASPRYGEHMAWQWLEAARYADSNGYQTDGEREMWRWRDWVIDAFNRNMPFDQFTIEQIAGDMLPNATLDQKIATAFNRNHRGNGEGGVIPEEYAVEYVVDRVDTTSTVWLGLTTGCARCHDHKYDPITQQEFYQLFAFFNNVPEKGRAVKHGNSPPLIKTPTPVQQIELQALEQKLATAEQRFAERAPEVSAAQEQWERSLQGRKLIDWSINEGLLAHYPLDGNARNTADESETDKSKRGEFQEGSPTFVPSRINQGASFDGKRFIDAGDVANLGFYDKFSLGAWVYVKGEMDGAILSRIEDTAEAQGYSLSLKDGKVQLALCVRWLDDAIRVESESRVSSNRWHHVMATYDGSRVASGTRIYVDGEPVKLIVLLDELNQDFKIKEPLRIGSLVGSKGRFHGYIDDVRIYSTDLRAEDVRIITTSDSISDIVAIPHQHRSERQTDKLRRFFLEEHAPRPIENQWQELVSFRNQKEEFEESISTTMVMQEMETPRDTFVLVRGAYDKPGEKVTADVPAIFPSMPPGEKKDRLGFARWLVATSNPLTARVIANRYWQKYFGRGLVSTAENFGSQGERPTHPRLLDWLAVEFTRSGWDMKALQKTIVMSATYRQSSKVRPELLQKDPQNLLLARAPRLRLPAAVIRDQVLAASGLLVERIGGPSVRPHQPPGLWKELVGAVEYVPDSGENLYRRSLYTFWKRTIPPPSMATFDASDRETCVVRESRTNTPLQALNLMNDATYVEASRVLAERIMIAGGATPEERITLAFRLTTARPPDAGELEILIKSFHYQLSNYETNRTEAEQLISMGESPRHENLDISEVAAYTSVASLILNLDETVTRE